MRKLIFFTGLVALLPLSALRAQTFDLSAEIRPRFEYRHGYGTLMPDNVSPAAFVSQRTRLNFAYSHDKLSLYTSFQNISVWGDVATTANSAKNGLGVHEAWAAYRVSPAWEFRLGRQVIQYDDERIFGKVGWAQAERSHDALRVMFRPAENQQIDLGLALNANGETKFDEAYTVNQYRYMQYLWYHGDFSKWGVSLLALNLGNPFSADSVQKIAWSQTFGTRLDYKNNGFKADLAAYVQTGEVTHRSLSAWYIAGSLGKKLTDKFGVIVGAEYLSGTDQDQTGTDLHAFNPWFGTNHKFNGWMDYFYVGNHTNSVGLTDIYAAVQYATGKWAFDIRPHYFSAPANIMNVEQPNSTMDPYLGTEIDFQVGYKLAKDVKIQAGYSQMFASETMQVLKGEFSDNTNNWAWLMVTFNPSLLHHTVQNR